MFCISKFNLKYENNCRILPNLPKISQKFLHKFQIFFKMFSTSFKFKCLRTVLEFFFNFSENVSQIFSEFFSISSKFFWALNRYLFQNIKSHQNSVENSCKIYSQLTIMFSIFIKTFSQILFISSSKLIFSKFFQNFESLFRNYNIDM